MRAKNRSVLLNVALGALILGVIAWGIPFEGEWVGPVRAVLLLLTFVCWAAWFITTPTARRVAANELRSRFAAVYECDGLAFAPLFSLRNGTFWIDNFFQNRFTQPCRAGVFVMPMEGWSPDGPPGAPAVLADIDCAGGESGVVSHACRIGNEWRGRLMIYDLYAVAEYPGGRGEQLTEEEGVRVGGPTNEAINAFRVAFGLLHGGFTHLTAAVRPRPGKIEIRLPEHAAVPTEEDAVPQRRTLPEWDECTKRATTGVQPE